MFNAKMRDEVIRSFGSEVERVGEIMRDLHRIKTYLDAGADSYVRDSLHKINDFIAECVPQGLEVDEISVGANVNANVINMTVKTKKSDAVCPMRVKKVVVRRNDSTDDTMYEECVEAIYDVYVSQLEAAMAQKNIDKVNAVLADILQRAGLDYSVKLTSFYGHSEDKKIAYLSDNEVVFICDKENIFNCNNFAILRDPDAILTESDIEKAKSDIAEEISVAQNTLQFVQNKGFVFITHLCDIPKTKKMSRVVRKMVSKNVMFANNRKTGGIMYYDVDNVYAILEVKDGEIDVILSPFDLETFKYVEKDILAEIK